MCLCYQFDHYLGSLVSIYFLYLGLDIFPYFRFLKIIRICKTSTCFISQNCTKGYIQKGLALYPNSGNNHIYLFLFFSLYVSCWGKNYNCVTLPSSVHMLHMPLHILLLSHNTGNHSVSLRKLPPHFHPASCTGLHCATTPECTLWMGM